MYEELRQNIERKITLTDEEWKLILDKTEFIKLKKMSFCKSRTLIILTKVLF